MADVSDIEDMVQKSRRLIVGDQGAPAIRAFDGIAALMIEVIRELRRLNENLEKARP